MKNQNGKIFWLLALLAFCGCKESHKDKLNISTNNLEYKISFDSAKISSFEIEDSDLASVKALTKKLSDYTTSELEKLPEFKRLTLSIVVPFDISKENLENTLKYIVNKETKKNNDIDEILIFAYDDKSDIGKGFTFGKLVWAPNGQTGNITPEIAQRNVRTNYDFDILIKNKVGKISKSDLPTNRELEIYNMIMDDKYLELDEDELNKMVMKKFNIKTKEELDEIWLKVAAYKN